MNTIRIETMEIAGFYPAFKGMRNAKNSWKLSDSRIHFDRCISSANYSIGENDLKLAQTLIKGGNEHSKFLRQIQVWADMNLPRYMWSEFDTYGYNTKNSCSTMHKLFEKEKEISLNDFYFETDEERFNVMQDIELLNHYRKLYFETTIQSEKDSILKTAKRKLPESFLQLRTVNTNYAELRNIYFQRRHHRLKKEWQEVFCGWLETLPYTKELIIFESK